MRVKLLLTLLLIMQAAQVIASPLDRVRTEARATFLTLSEWEAKGANLSQEAALLNRALELARSGNYQEALSLIEYVKRIIPERAKQSIERAFWDKVGRLTLLTLVVLVEVLAYLYLPKLFWRLWAYFRKDWVVSKVK